MPTQQGGVKRVLTDSSIQVDPPRQQEFAWPAPKMIVLTASINLRCARPLLTTRVHRVTLRAMAVCLVGQLLAWHAQTGIGTVATVSAQVIFVMSERHALALATVPAVFAGKMDRVSRLPAATAS